MTITLIALALLIAIGYLMTRDQAGMPATDVLVAGNFPLSGELSYYGEAFRDGLVMASEESEPESSKNVRLVFDWGDNKFSPKEAATVLQQQLTKKPTIYTSALKPQVMAISEQLSDHGIPHFPWILDFYANSDGSKNNFRTWVSFKLEASVFIRYAREKKAERVAFVFLSLPSTEQEYGDVIIPALTEDPACETLTERFTTTATGDDFRTIAKKVADFEPDIIMINGFIPQMVGLVRALRPTGVIKDGNTLAALDMLDAADAIAPEESEGIVVAAPEYLLNKSHKQTQWAKRFNARFNREPPYHSAFAYDMGLVLKDAASRLRLPATNEEWIESIQACEIDGITGPIRFDSDGSQVTTLAPAIYRNGRLVPVDAEERSNGEVSEALVSPGVTND